MSDGAEATRSGTAELHDETHPSPMTYIKVGAALGIITLIEVGIFYVEALAHVLVPIFLLLSAVKFVLVALFYMHLKFDNRLFSVFFGGGMMVAVVVISALLVLYHGYGADSTRASEVTTVTEEQPVANGLASEIPVGAQVFVGRGCGGCHSIDGVEGADGQVGPGLDGLATKALSRRPGLTAEQYIRESIEQPSVFVVEDFDPVMPGLRGTMTDQQFEDLVAFLQTLG